MTQVISKNQFFKEIGYDPYLKQQQYHDSKARFKVMVAGRRAGKSTMAARDLEPELFLPNRRYWIVGPTYELAEREFRVIWDDLIIGQKLGQNKKVRRAYTKKQGSMWIEFPWQTRVEVRSASHPESLVGEGLHGVIISEAAKHVEDTWERYIRPSLADYRGWATFPSTPEGQNWLHKLWQFGQNPDPSYGDYECVDEKTEILTQRGWLKFDEIVPDEDKALSINTKTGLSEWDTIEIVNKYPGKHDLIRMESNQFSSLTTKNHRWLSNISMERARQQRIRSGWRWRTTEKLTKDDRIPKAAPCIDIPSNPKYTDEFVELVAWIWTEGSINAGNETSFEIHQSHEANPENVTRIRGVLQRFCPNPIDGRVSDSGYWSEKQKTVTNGYQKWPITKFYLGASLSRNLWIAFSSHKVVRPEFVLSLTAAQLRLFVEVSVLGDGRDSNDTEQTTTYIAQENQTQLQAVQMACCLLGIPTSIRKNNAPDGSTHWKLLIGKQSFIGPKQAAYNARRDLETGRRGYKKGMTIAEESYEGIVWCPRTKNGNWLARRSGSVYYTGNSWQFPSWENRILYPGGRNDPEIKQIELTTSPEWFDQEIGADFTAFTGRIYSEFQEHSHVKPCPYNPMWKNVMVWDWGFVHPLACIEFQIDPWDNIYIWREHYGAYKTLEEHLNEVKSRPNPPDYRINYCFGDAADPGAAATVTQHLTPCWVDPAAKSGKGESGDAVWREGVELVKKFLKSYETGETDEYGTPVTVPKLFVDHSCPYTIKEFNNYKAKEPPRNSRNRSSGRDAAQDFDNHCMDAIRYGLMHMYKLGAQHSLGEAMPSLTGNYSQSDTIFKSSDFQF